MIHKARFNAILLLITIAGATIFGLSSGAESSFGFVFLMFIIAMLAKIINLVMVAGGKPLFYNVRTETAKDGALKSH
jgi:hypothetical protein